MSSWRRETIIERNKQKKLASDSQFQPRRYLRYLRYLEFSVWKANPLPRNVKKGCGLEWRGWAGSNSRPRASEARALSIWPRAPCILYPRRHPQPLQFTPRPDTGRNNCFDSHTPATHNTQLKWECSATSSTRGDFLCRSFR